MTHSLSVPDSLDSGETPPRTPDPERHDMSPPIERKEEGGRKWKKDKTKAVLRLKLCFDCSLFLAAF